MALSLDQWFAAAKAGNDILIVTNLSSFAGSKNDRGETALMLATYNDHTSIVSRLCPYEARSLDDTGKAAIHVAVERDNYDTCTALGPHEREILTQNGMTPYHLAARLGKEKAMDALAIFFGMERDANGLSVIEHALIGESEKCLEHALANHKVRAKDVLAARSYAEEYGIQPRMIDALNRKLSEYDSLDLELAAAMASSTSPHNYLSSIRSSVSPDPSFGRNVNLTSSQVSDGYSQEMRQITGSFRCVPVNPHSEERERIDELIAAKDALLKEHMAERLSPGPRSRSNSISPEPPVFTDKDTRSFYDDYGTSSFRRNEHAPTSPLGINSFRSPPPQPGDDGDTIDDIINTLDNVSRQTKLQENMGVPLPRRTPPQPAYAPMEPLEKLTNSFTASAFADDTVKEKVPVPRLPQDNYDYKDYPQHSGILDINKVYKPDTVDAINLGLDKLTASQRIIDKGLTSKTATLASQYDPRKSQYKEAIDKANSVIGARIEPVRSYTNSMRAPSKNKAVRKAVAVLGDETLPTIEEIQKATKSNITASAIVPPLATTIPSDEGRKLTQSFIGGQPLMSSAANLESSLRFYNTGTQEIKLPPPMPQFEETASVEELIASHKQNHPQVNKATPQFTSLMKAAVENDISAAMVLVVSFARIQDPNGKTALMYAAERGHEEIANLLMPFEGGMQLKNGGTALMHALGNGHLNIASMLMACDGGLAMDDGWTALMSAATINADNIITGLLDKEAGMVCNHLHKQGEGYCACMIAAKKNNLESLRLLAPYEGAITNFMGQNALSFARTPEARELLSLFH